MKVRRVCLTVLSAGAVAAGGLVGSTQASATASPGRPAQNVSHSVSASEATAAAKYWTKARMASARQLDAVASSAVGAQPIAAGAKGKPVTVQPTAGTGNLAAGRPAPLHATVVARPYTNLPDRLNGKVFFSDGGSNFVCSGTVVNGTNKDLVDTAGHCVSSGTGRFFTNWVFVPAYSSAASGAGDRPFGTWTARILTTRTEWHSFSNLKQDLGYAALNTLGGQHIVNQLGGQGSRFNQARNKTYKAFGYPQAAPFNGFDQRLCTSTRLANDNPTPARPGPLTMRIHCNLTGGASGGGWLVGLSGGLGFVHSHNSYRYVSGPLTNPDHMYGPYYGNEALSLFNLAQSQ